jgi:hypothetical protein
MRLAVDQMYLDTGLSARGFELRWKASAEVSGIEHGRYLEVGYGGPSSVNNSACM